MCVILAVEQDTKPDLKMLQACEKYNDDGAGVAWIEGKHVLWKKGLTAQEVFDLQGNIDPPYLIHFRWATSGGVTPQLCHPFPITRKAGLELSGKIIKGKLLMHNGIWSEQEWKKDCKKTMLTKNTRMPQGKWSDTRAMTWLTHVWGEGVLETMPGKIAVLSARGIVYYGDDWPEYEETGIFCSNLSFTWASFNWEGWEYTGSGRSGGGHESGEEWPYCDWKCDTCKDPICSHWDEYEEHLAERIEAKRYAQEEAAWAAYQAEQDAIKLAPDDGPTPLYNSGQQVIQHVLGTSAKGKKIHVIDGTGQDHGACLRNDKVRCDDTHDCDSCKNSNSKSKMVHPCEVCNAVRLTDCDDCPTYLAGQAGIPPA